ncbi:hypothetical protein V6N11_048891 [Hibiscus sabdariffa]|uniref:Methyltransferase n=1 Tax=Hibiscus sabdariffa TaxID=183260 RepID=A0ABR2PWT0_9ROSI
MPSKRRRRQEDRPRIHPKNKNSGNRPDFALLASLYPTCSTTATANPESTGLTSMPPANSPASSSFRTTTSIGGSPMVSSALLANSKGDIVRGFDIGTGANCIYPLLGASFLGWNFVASDVTDVALEWAERNV